jgi:hypothetical protein
MKMCVPYFLSNLNLVFLCARKQEGNKRRALLIGLGGGHHAKGTRGTRNQEPTETQPSPVIKSHDQVAHWGGRTLLWMANKVVPSALDPR